jgi:hypothetical protein
MTDAISQRVVDAIAEMLETALRHPGQADEKQPPVAFIGPMFRTKGQPPQIADAIRANNKAIAQCVVHLIESDLGCQIVPKSETG